MQTQTHNLPNLNDLLPLLAQPPVKPNRAQMLGAAIGAILFPRAAPSFLTSPLQWAKSETARQQAQMQRALDLALKIAALGVEQQKASAPVQSAALRAQTERELAQQRTEQVEKPRLQLEERRLQEVDVPRAQAETARTEAIAADIQQRTQLNPKERYVRLAEQYAQYLGSERYTPQGDEAYRRALRLLEEQIGAEPQTETSAKPQPSPAQQKAQAEAQLIQERAVSEKELREPRKQQIQAKTNLIKAETLLAAKRRDEIDANIHALRNRVAQGWSNVSLRARGLALAAQQNNDKLLVQLLTNARITIQNIDNQIAELRKAKAQIAYPQTMGGAGVPAYDPQEIDALIRELQEQKKANQGIVQLGAAAVQRLQRRVGQ